MKNTRKSHLSNLALLTAFCLGTHSSAQVASQISLTYPSTGQGTPLSISSAGREISNHNLSRSTSHDGDIAEVTNATSWDINPAAGSMSVNSTSSYSGWTSSAVSLDTRYAFALFDTFTVNAGDSGFANGESVEISLSLNIQASAQTDAFNSQTGSNFLDFTVQRRNPTANAFGSYPSEQLFSLDYDVTVYEFYERAIVNGVTQINNTDTYDNGQGNEADVYQFDIVLDAIVGETVEIGMLLGDLDDYDYDIDNLISGTRQNLASSQEDYGNQFSASMSWDIEAVDGFEGLELAAASGFDPSINTVPEPSTYALILGLFGFATCLIKRSKHS